MRQALAYYDGAVALIRRDWTTYKSYRTQLVSTPFSIFISMCLFYYVSRLIQVSSYGDPDQYFSFIVVGMLTLVVLQSTLMVAGSVRSELVAGTFERMLLSPFGSAAGVAAMMLFPFVVSLVTSTVTLLLAWAVFELPVQWSTAWIAIPVAILGAGTFAALGMLFAATVLIFKRMMAGAGLILTLISFTSGVYFPVALLPDWIEWFSDVQPFTPSIQLLRHVLIGAEVPGDDPWLLVLKIAGFVIVMIPAGFVALRAATRVGQRTGTIIEY
jgi:ABC-type polysaccharide/polyol phosphate export permease